MSEIHNATGGNYDAPSTAGVRSVVDENRDLRALLAQRDRELEALRGMLNEIQLRIGGARLEGLACLLDNLDREGRWSDDSTQAQDDLRAVRVILNNYAVVALSDNPESPALTDKEA